MTGPDVPALLELALCLCDDFAAMFPFHSGSLRRDYEYISKRVRDEGLSFLTKVLPNLGKSFDFWLRTEDLSVDIFHYAEYTPPKFLQGVRTLVRDERLSAGERASVYRWIRQLAYLFYKLEIAFTKEQLDEAYHSFAMRDSELQESDSRITPYQVGEASRLIGEVMGDFNPRDFIPKHGPGAVATREVGDAKWIFKRKYESLHRRFPMYDYFVPTLNVWSSDPDYVSKWYKSLERLDSPQARVVAVPKDSRGPRLISEEPLELQFMQQAYLALLVPHIEGHSLTRGFINFTRQDINQKLALDGSKTGEWATIDLSEASDRVSDYLVYLLFSGEKYRDLCALRSTSTLLPNGVVVQLRKFAPMGSAICFPIEALVFWAVAKSAIRSATCGSDGDVYVYGDDIIVRTEHYDAVCRALEGVGLKVNTNKSYYTGSFRESCGVDAWNGFKITPARLKQIAPSKLSDVKGLLNWISVSNTLRESGFRITSDAIVRRLTSITQVPWNIHGTQLSFIDRLAGPDELRALNKGFKFRWNPEKCLLECYCHVLRQKKERSKLGGWPRLHRQLLGENEDPDNWQPRNRVGIKQRWTSVHQCYGSNTVMRDFLKFAR